MWFAIVKVLEADRLQPSHDLGSLIGVIGEARTEIHAEGTAQVGGELWSARSNRLIPADAKVRVIGREGLVLIVEIVP
jgi:membrane-bound ClpP family serine protease